MPIAFCKFNAGMLECAIFCSLDVKCVLQLRPKDCGVVWLFRFCGCSFRRAFLIETMVRRIEMVLLRNFLISMLWQTLVQACSRDG